MLLRFLFLLMLVRDLLSICRDILFVLGMVPVEKLWFSGQANFKSKLIIWCLKRNSL